jgi:hypothetical protein
MVISGDRAITLPLRFTLSSEPLDVSFSIQALTCHRAQRRLEPAESFKVANAVRRHAEQLGDRIRS